MVSMNPRWRLFRMLKDISGSLSGGLSREGRAQRSSIGSVPFAENHNVGQLWGNGATIRRHLGYHINFTSRQLRDQLMQNPVVRRDRANKLQAATRAAFYRFLKKCLYGFVSWGDICCREKRKIRGGSPRRDNLDAVEYVLHRGA